MLKYKNTRTVNLQDWDNFVKRTYDKPYSFQQQDGCKPRGSFQFTIPSEYTEDEYMNDFIPDVINGDEMGVKFAVWLERDPNEWNGEKGEERYLNMFWGRNFYPDIYTIANDLHAKGLIESGEYTIEIDW